MSQLVKFKQILKRHITLFDVFYVIDNDRSVVMDAFSSLQDEEKKRIKDLIKKMVTVKDFRSDKIKHLKGYPFYEIRIFPHRFFYFQKSGNNIIFFDYILKKVNSFPDKVYKEINKKKEKYEQEFERFIQRR